MNSDSFTDADELYRRPRDVHNGLPRRALRRHENPSHAGFFCVSAKQQKSQHKRRYSHAQPEEQSQRKRTNEKDLPVVFLLLGGNGLSAKQRERLLVGVREWVRLH